MMIFSEDTKIARSILAMIALYLASLLEVGKSKCMAYSIISSIRALSCSPSLAPVCSEAPSTFRAHQLELSISFHVEEFLLKSRPISAPLKPSEVYIEYRTHLSQSPIESSSLIDRAYV